eukprot:1139323-Pelagomonas_calceolata.AAC.2
MDQETQMSFAENTSLLRNTFSCTWSVAGHRRRHLQVYGARGVVCPPHAYRIDRLSNCEANSGHREELGGRSNSGVRDDYVLLWM